MQHKKHNATLDGLRGVAAADVAIGHSQAAAYQMPTTFHGNFAVDFFFILSGFVLARAYERRLTTGMTVMRFMKLRVIRLFPLVCLGVALSVLLGTHDFTPVQMAVAILLALCLIPCPIGPNLFPFDGVIWSLFWEVWANLLYAILVRHRRIHFGLAAFGAAILLYITARGHHISGGFTLSTAPAGLGRILWGFFAGVALNGWLTPARVERLPAVPFPLLAVVFLVAVINYRLGPWYDDLCILLLFPAIVALGVKDIAAGKARKAALISGALSYPIYILHPPFVDTLRRCPGAPAIVLMLVLLAVAVLSYAALRWFDEPVRAWLLSHGRKQQGIPIQDAV